MAAIDNPAAATPIAVFFTLDEGNIVLRGVRSQIRWVVVCCGFDARLTSLGM